MAATARRLLDASTLCAIATVTADVSAHVNSAYFAWSRDFHIVWLSEPRARHSRNLRVNNSVAIAVYDSTQTWGTPDRGIQLFGSAREVGGENDNQAETLYAKRFPDFTETDLGAYGFYVFRARRLKLFDERALGAGTFVTARLTRDRRLAWERGSPHAPTSRSIRRTTASGPAPVALCGRSTGRIGRAERGEAVADSVAEVD